LTKRHCDKIPLRRNPTRQIIQVKCPYYFYYYYYCYCYYCYYYWPYCHPNNSVKARRAFSEKNDKKNQN